MTLYNILLIYYTRVNEFISHTYPSAYLHLCTRTRCFSIFIEVPIGSYEVLFMTVSDKIIIKLISISLNRAFRAHVYTHYTFSCIPRRYNNVCFPLIGCFHQIN